jgi:hypothetical protein
MVYLVLTLSLLAADERCSLVWRELTHSLEQHELL